MILVIMHTQERNEFDHCGQLISEQGTVWVSHGINTQTDKVVVLPGERWAQFQHEWKDIADENSVFDGEDIIWVN